MCDFPLFFLDLNFFIFSKKTLIGFCSPLKKILSLKFGFETWNLELRVWNFSFWCLWSSLRVYFSFKITKFWYWHHLFLEIFGNLWNFFIHSSWFFLFLKEFFFEGWLSQLNQTRVDSTTEVVKKKWEGEFWPPFLVFFFFIFAFLSSFFLLPPLLLFTHFTNLHFLPHYTISSLKIITFLSFSVFFHSSPSISFQIFVFLTIFATNPFLKPISKPPFSLHWQWHLPMGLPFSLLVGKNITHLFNGMMKKGSFKTPRPMLHTPT